jgi:2'-5' RNA ligase
VTPAIALPDGGGTQRLFFALWPDSAAAQALAELAGVLAPGLAGKAVPMEKIHLTLAFLGELPPQALERAITAGDVVRAGEFDLALDHAGSFRGARVAWAGTSTMPGGLARLHAELRSALIGQALPVEERPFAPHATLVRKIARPLPRTDLRAIAWTAEGFSLMRSERGSGRYTTLAAWDLAPQ